MWSSLPLEIQRGLARTKDLRKLIFLIEQTKVYYIFCTLSEKKQLKNLQLYHNNEPFLLCICFWYNFHWWMFFILCDKWKALFIVALKVFPTAMLLRSGLKVVCILCYLHNISTVTARFLKFPQLILLFD